MRIWFRIDGYRLVDDKLEILLQGLPNLKELNLCENRITSTGIKMICKQKPLEKLNLSFNVIGNEGVEQLCSQLPQLVALEIGKFRCYQECLYRLCEDNGSDDSFTS